MHNKNTIDDIVRNALQDGKERLNLGSWANMERMLNGQNPYAQPEEEKKKRGFWLFGLLMAGVLLIGGGIYKYATNHNKPTIVANTDVVINPANNNQNNVSTSQLPEPIPSSNISNKDVDNSSNTNPTTSSKNNSNSSITTISSNNNFSKSINNIDANNQTSSDAIPNNSTTNFASISDSKPKNIRKSNTENTQIAKNSMPQDAVDNGLQNKNSTNADVVNNITSDNKISTNSEISIEPKSKNILQKIFAKKDKKQKESELQQPIVTNNSIDNLVTTTKKSKRNKQADSVTAVSIKYKKHKSDDGIVQTKEVTVTKSVNKAILEETSAEIFVPDGSINPQNYNPRLVALTAEDDIKASAKPGVIKPKNKIPKSEIVTAAPTTIRQNTEIAEVKNNVTTTSKPIKLKSTEDSKAMQAIENVKEAAKKLGYLGIFNKKIETNPGVFAGINGSFFNAKHNFGGFQAGSNLLIKLTETFSIIPHLGFYYRNNGGYSVKDFNTNIVNKSTSISTDSLFKIYNYTLDSTQLSYNFKHVYNIEAPIIFNYAKRDFGFFAGVNLSYGLQMKPTNTSKQYSVNKNVAISIDSPSTSFSYPTSQNTFYKSTDFQSRFGIGYVVGMSYDFHPNLYVDFRMTQIAKDNSGTVSAIEMSKQFFRVPSMQIGIGYRFKEKDRVRYR